MEHEVELFGFREFAAFVCALGESCFFLTHRDVFKLIGAVAFFTNFTVYHWIRKPADVAGGGQHGLVGEDGAVHADDVIALLDVFAPPDFFEVAFELGAEWAVVPASVQASVEFGRLEDEPFAFAERDDFFHSFGIGMCAFGHGGGTLGSFIEESRIKSFILPESLG